MVGRIQGGKFCQKGTRVFGQRMKVERINDLYGESVFLSIQHFEVMLTQLENKIPKTPLTSGNR